ncbi:hypothetical protein N788_03510 [Arenimonas donghaensis DSM 18148 = HO3-R19]|uniref:Uncharacterized protein n=1 Tax=Arenimonas donghaensis DSM 18148 = HO3-R19 TaxID=1121014 RepID=A0A087MII8_9GAMM|nr:hypothetical protein N788_03510 [Arenimonas donghaensis DSM 18148 = HO3-R19]
MAGGFVLSLGLLTGASHGATQWSGASVADVAPDSPGLLDRAQAKACEWSHGLSGRSDRRGSEQRRTDCARRHGLAD